LWEGWLIGRGDVRGRDWESRETGKGGGRGMGELKLGKGERGEKGACPSDSAADPA
jgi:hypothetical protein